ncbi:hypothetical protein TNIN_497721 [Trichonephila inaurata madagascariensis]|uniref:Uncharacterized protein n=1 Tax=Trichonephila inaurata madagascariensis TaxID=2747483 RepID=A0A8X6Y0E7_9ARAC|nr:hypothetical protein TNIN_497721 [Trichonephila inaurata madagascariensis]
MCCWDSSLTTATSQLGYSEFHFEFSVATHSEFLLEPMSRMESEPSDITNGCHERSRISPEIEGLDIIISHCLELVNLPDTNDKPRDEGYSPILY